ncbi:MAG: hypothetical protein LBH31_08430 [Burkholderiaceae bacterium]|jgi:hypothetical protein|nr:hypothetical protein [Burkholderiaceae bacterium]
MPSGDESFRAMELELELPQPAPATPQPPYVPVLSEVIGGRSAAPVSPAPPAAAPVFDPRDALVRATTQAVLRTLGPEFEQRLAQAMSRALHEQLQGLHTRVRQTLAREVHAAVTAALKPPQPSSSNNTPSPRATV